PTGCGGLTLSLSQTQDGSSDDRSHRHDAQHPPAPAPDLIVVSHRFHPSDAPEQDVSGGP
ncbi:hypothetical protein ACFFOU_26965, partial [Pseudonocardia sulfidoxydans]|uniref:hypothetical protein n=1 Tax=Pseudonocardia sulfidoxydans TaxID=54011 RepID=UPI0035E9F451